MAEVQREVELLEQRANDQAAELEALRASNKKQGRLIRAIRPLSRGRGCRILGHVIGGELGPQRGGARENFNERWAFTPKFTPEPRLPSTSFKL